MEFRQAGVLGAGTMGARIAAHLANAGLLVVLLDVAGRGPSTKAAESLEDLKRAKPAAFYAADLAALVRTGDFDRDLELLAACDWVIEAVTENLEIKQALLERVAPYLKPEAVLSTNTSGLPLGLIGQVLPAPLRRRWLGTHFFNPPRQMRLVEVIATPETDPAVVAEVASFADVRLGKEVVLPRDTPNFIANRIGVFALIQALQLMEELGLTVEEVDLLTGSAIGWPRTGTCRLADLIGIDVLAHVAANFERSGPAEAERVRLPEFLQTMLERRWLGDKTGHGFYRKHTDTAGRELRFTLEWKTLEYRGAARPVLPALAPALAAGRLSERLPLLLMGDPHRDPAAQFHWRLLSSLWNYAADCQPEIADDVSSVDRAMRAGFNWEMGPFELWDAAGVPAVVERMRHAGETVSASANKLLASGATSWYRDRGRASFDPASGTYRSVPRAEGMARIADSRASHGIVRQVADASLVDLGEGVACIELHAEKDTVGEEIARFIADVLQPESGAMREFTAFVIATDAASFSAGTELAPLLLAAQEREWDRLDRAVRTYQRMTWAIKFCPRPVVAAPCGTCLGSGAEMTLHAARRQAHAELFMGIAETAAGIVPFGGGLKEMALRAIDAAIDAHKAGEAGGLLDALRHHLTTIAWAKASTSAREAHKFGFLDDRDGITMNRERLLNDARDAARTLAASAYAAPLPRTGVPAPGESIFAALSQEVQPLRQAGSISDHDAKIAHHVARVLCGGAVPPGTPVSEQSLLDLEREAFLSLCGESKTQERIARLLRTGRSLKN